jgi:hypothetical protein
MRTFQSQLVVASAFLVMLSAAAQANVGSNQPLTTEQKAVALDMFQSATLATATIDAFNPQMVPGAPAGQDAVSQKWLQMTGIIKASVQSGACQIQNTQTNAPDGSSTTGLFAIGGSGCQLNYNLQSQNWNGGGNENSGYKVNDAGFAALNDVNALTMKSDAKISQNANHGFVIAAEGTGTFHSQQLGDLTFSLTASGTLDMQGAGSVTSTIQAQLPGFAAELKTVNQNQGGVTTNSYFLNDVLLTTDEVNTYILFPFAPHPAHSVGGVFGIALK